MNFGLVVPLRFFGRGWQELAERLDEYWRLRLKASDSQPVFAAPSKLCRFPAKRFLKTPLLCV